MPFANPIKKDSHLIVLNGNLAPEGAVAKLTGKEGLSFTGPARVFEGEERATAAILAGKVRAGDVVVIRGEGPVGGPGHARNAQSHRRHHGPGPGRQGRPDHRRALFGRQPWVCCRTPLTRSRAGRPDRRCCTTAISITIDARKRSIEVDLECRGTQASRRAWRAPRPYTVRGVLAVMRRVGFQCQSWRSDINSGDVQRSSGCCYRHACHSDCNTGNTVRRTRKGALRLPALAELRGIG